MSHLQREIDPEVLVAITEMTRRGYGDVRPVVQVEEVVRRLDGLAADKPIPGTRNAMVALALKDLRARKLVEYGSHLRDVNLGYRVTDEGEKLADGIIETAKRRAAERAAEERQVVYEDALRDHFKRTDGGNTHVDPHEFKPLQRFRNGGRCAVCFAHEDFHPTLGWVPARPLGDKQEAFRAA